MSLWSRLTNVFRAGRVERELDEELQFHVEERIRELMADGHDARGRGQREVARRFGNPLRLREESLDVKLLPWLDSIVRDVRLGVRMLRKNAVVTGAAVAVAVARARRVRRGVFAGRRADSQAAAGAPARSSWSTWRFPPTPPSGPRPTPSTIRCSCGCARPRAATSICSR